VSRVGYHDVERMALGFALEDETWPVFLEWARRNGWSAELREWLAAGPDLDGIRREYLSHSPDPVIRAMAAQHPEADGA
jgi:hypothetical protein